MAGLSASYLAKTAVYFEPLDAGEAEAIQRRLLELGYGWGPQQQQKKIAYVQKCVQHGITALPGGGLFCGEPSDVKVMRHSCEDLTGVPTVRAVAQKLVPVVADSMTAIDELRRDIRREAAAAAKDLQRQFEDVGRRQATLENNQHHIMRQLDEVLTLLRSTRVDLRDKKAVRKP